MPVTGNNRTNDNRLSIRIFVDGFSFYASEAFTGQVLCDDAYRQIDEQSLSQMLDRVLEREQQKAICYTQVEVVVHGNSTRIPLDEFRREELTGLYRLVFAEVNLQHQEVLYRLLPNLEVVELFCIPQTVKDKILSCFPQAVFTSDAGAVLEEVALAERLGDSNTRTLHAHINEGQLLLCYIQNGRLSYANTFPAQQAADALYYLLYAWKTLEFDAMTDHLHVSGASTDCSMLAEQAAQYIRLVEIKI